MKKITDYITAIILIYLIIALLTSCVPNCYLVKHKAEICAKCIEENIIQFSKDSIITKIDTLWIDVSENLIDSTYTELYFECDSDNQVLMTKIEKVKESGQIISQYQFKNNILTVKNKVYQDSIMQLNSTIERIKSDVKIVDKIVNKEVIPKWVYLVGIIVFLFLIILLIIILKK